MTTMDDFVSRSAARKGDRAAMALQVVDLAGEYQLAAWYIPEVKGTRRAYADLQCPRGLKLTVKFDGGSQDPDTYVLSWYGVEGARLRPGKFGSVNSYHGHKATDVAHGFAELLDLLRRRFASIRDDSAFEVPSLGGHEHVTELNPPGTDKLRKWLVRPSGSLTMGRVTFEAVAGGGILVRTQSYTGPEVTS